MTKPTIISRRVEFGSRKAGIEGHSSVSGAGQLPEHGQPVSAKALKTTQIFTHIHLYIWIIKAVHLCIFIVSYIM